MDHDGDEILEGLEDYDDGAMGDAGAGYREIEIREPYTCDSKLVRP